MRTLLLWEDWWFAAPEPRGTCLCLLPDIEPAATNKNLYLSENVAESIQDWMFRLRSSSLRTTTQRIFHKQDVLLRRQTFWPLLVKLAVDTTYVPQLSRCCSICKQQKKRPDKNKAPDKLIDVFKDVWPQICRIPTQITKPRRCKINNLQGSQQLYFVSRWISSVWKLNQVRKDLRERTVKFINTQDFEYRSGCGSSPRPPAPQTSALPTRLTLLRPNFKLYTDRSI